MDRVQAFKKDRSQIFERYSGPNQGMALVTEYALLMDRFLTGLFAEVSAGRPIKGLAMAALGGYGRGELAPFSDVDLLFLTAGPAEQTEYKPLIEAVLYPLWDLRLQVGQAVRTPAQCLEIAQEDFVSLSTQLDARFLSGDSTMFTEYIERLFRWLGSKPRKRSFFRELEKSVEERHHKYGESPYLLEPNIKDGHGGLRDIHAVHWAASGLYEFAEPEDMVKRGFLSADRVMELHDARIFMTNIRTILQLVANEKTDTLTFELQEEIAGRLNYQSDGHAAEVEKFMQEYYTHVYRTKNTLDYFLSRVREDLIPAKVWELTSRPRHIERGLSILRGQVELGVKPEVRARPELMMRAFEISAASGLPLSQRSLELIRNHLYLVDDDFRKNPRVIQSFLRALTAIPSRPPKQPDLQAAMQLLDFLEAYLPELGSVRSQVQHDAYHVHTVDVHLVLTLWELKKIAMGQTDRASNGFDQGVLEQVENREVLFMAALVHDIGKGHGSEHARVGAEMTRDISRRLNLSREQAAALEFLVAEHLFMPRTATRRDLTEEKLIIDCARRIGDVQRLHMLYLLTVADSKATGPGAINQWKAALIRDLYSKIYRVLTKSDLAGKETAERADALVNDVARLMDGQLSREDVGRHMERMSAQYLAVMNPEQVVKHIILERRLEKGEKTLIWEVEEKEGYCEVTIVTEDRPGLLSRMAGVFTLHHINILGAQVFTRTSNIALDTFHVSYPPDRLYAAEAWEKVRKDADRALTGHLALDYRLSKKRPLLKAAKTVTHVPDKVVVDNDVSDFYTVIEIYTYDRLGLLYEVTKTLYDLQLSIYNARISTQVEQVVDVFYVKDFSGQKMTDEEQIRELKEALQFTLEK